MSWDKPNLGDECKYDFIHTIPSKKLNSFTSKLLQTNEIRSKINRDRIKRNISKIVLKIPYNIIMNVIMMMLVSVV